MSVRASSSACLKSISFHRFSFVYFVHFNNKICSAHTYYLLSNAYTSPYSSSTKILLMLSSFCARLLYLNFVFSFKNVKLVFCCLFACSLFTFIECVRIYSEVQHSHARQKWWKGEQYKLWHFSEHFFLLANNSMNRCVWARAFAQIDLCTHLILNCVLVNCRHYSSSSWFGDYFTFDFLFFWIIFRHTWAFSLSQLDVWLLEWESC